MMDIGQCLPFLLDHHDELVCEQGSPGVPSPLQETHVVGGNSGGGEACWGIEEKVIKN